MILYWAWPTDGAGHAVRAAAICRWLKNDVLVIRGTNDPKINRALDHFGVPYKVITNRRNAISFVRDTNAKTMVLDDRCGSALDYKADLYLWRLGRPERTMKPMKRVNLEGPGAIGPVLMLEDAEILSKEEARKELGLPLDDPIIMGIPSTSRPGLIEEAEPDYMLTEWPALRWMRAADHIVGAPGANLYGEVSYLDLPVTWLKAPHARDQTIRLWSPPKRTVVKDAAKKIAQIIDELHGAP